MPLSVGPNAHPDLTLSSRNGKTVRERERRDFEEERGGDGTAVGEVGWLMVLGAVCLDGDGDVGGFWCWFVFVFILFNFFFSSSKL